MDGRGKNVFDRTVHTRYDGKNVSDETVHTRYEGKNVFDETVHTPYEGDNVSCLSGRQADEAKKILYGSEFHPYESFRTNHEGEKTPYEGKKIKVGSLLHK
jgi:hypothetical protein